jgi:O-antigen/teichoic acid export membrane protein
MSLARTIAKNSFFNLIATASDIVINFAIGILLARGLGTGGYGLYSLLMWFLGFAIMAVNLGAGDMGKRFVAEALGRGQADEPAKIIRLSLLLRSVAALVVTLVVLFFAGYWARLFGGEGNRTYFFILSFGLLPNVLNIALISIFAGFQKYEYGAYLTLATNPLRLVGVAVFMVTNLGVKEVLILNISIWALGVVIGIALLHRLIPIKDIISAAPMESATRKTALKFALTVAGVLVVEYFLWRESEVMFLGAFRPAEEVGFYSLAVKLPYMAMTLIPSVFGMVLLPSITEQFGRGDMDRLRTIYLSAARYLMILALPLAAAGIALARPLVIVLYGSEYTPVILLMQVLFIPFAMMSIALAATSTIYGINQPSFILKVGLFLICLSIGLDLWLIPRYGMMGAAIGSSIPRLIAVPIYIRFASRRIGVTWPLADTAKIVLASLITGAALFILQSYLNDILSLILSIPLGIAIYVVAILVLRAINSRDLETLRGMQSSLPPVLRNSYSKLLSSMEMFTQIKPLIAESDTHGNPKSASRSAESSQSQRRKY